MPSLRLLYLEDSPRDAELSIAVLEDAGYVCEWDRVDSRARFVAALGDPSRYDIILADYRLPAFDGLTALRIVREGKIDLPVILVSGTLGEEVAIESLKAGATDYVLKARLARLAPVVRRALAERANERQRALVEQALHNSRQFLEAVVETAPVLIVVADANDRIVAFNRACEQVSGYRREEVLGKPAAELPLPTQWADFVRRQSGSLVDRVPCPAHEHPWRTRSGTERIIEWRCVGVPAPDDSAIWILGAGVDITERKEAERALCASEHRYQTLAEVAPVGIFHADASGNCTYINERCCRFSGLSQEDARGDGWLAALHPEDRERLAAEWRSGLQTGRPFRSECRIRHSDGAVAWVFAQAAPDRDASGAVVGYVGAVTNITEQKQAEQTIRNLNQELERRVMQRTAQLEATNKELEAFSYSVSHDLRGPLRAIAGFSQVLGEEVAERLDERGRHYLTRIRAGTEQMNRLIDALLTLSRMARMEMQLTGVDLSALAEAVAAEQRDADPERQVTVVVEPGLTAHGDPRLLRVLMTNLLHNAWKYTGKEEQARIVVGAEEHDGERRFFVRDNGVGFDEARADKLFAPFQRLHSTAEFEGSGIGLATAQRIVNRHGGHLCAHGAPDRGATFYFTIPDR